MAYTKQTWENQPSTASPLSAARLNHIETGVDEAHEALAEITRNARAYAKTAAQRSVLGNGVSKPLSGYYATLAAAQADYPHVTALTNELDWAVVQAALNDGPGTTLVPASIGGYMIDAELATPSGGNLRGACGGFQTSWFGTTFRLTTAGAKLSFGVRTTPHRGDESGHFNVDANSIATQPFYIGRSVGRSFKNITIRNAAAGGTALLIEEAQNNDLETWQIADCAGDGITYDRGAGGNVSTNVNVSGCSGWTIVFHETSGGGLTGIFPEPTHNGHYHCIYERPVAGVAPGILKHTAGHRNHFNDCPFAAVTATTAIPVIFMSKPGANTSANLLLANCSLSGPTSGSLVTGVQIQDSTSIRFLGMLRMLNLQTGFNLASSLPTIDIGHRFATGVTTMYGGAGTPTSVVRHRLPSTLEMSLPNATDPSVIGILDAEIATGLRYRIRADGQIGWGDGTSFTPDTVVYRSAADRIKTDDSVLFADKTTAASAATVTLPAGNFVIISGTTSVDTITATNNSGRLVIIQFISILTMNDATGNLRLAGNFTTKSGDTLTLICDGTNWFEVSRSVN